jgi:hypothetical protein
MSRLYVFVKPVQLRNVTEREYHFEEHEHAHGIKLPYYEDAPERRLWKLISEFQTLDPYTSTPVPTIEQAEREVSVAYDMEMIEFSHMMRAWCIVRKHSRESDDSVKSDMDRVNACHKFNSLNNSWLLSKMQRQQCEHTWTLIRNERITNLRAALQIVSDMYKQAAEGQILSDLYTWVPSGRLFEQLREEADSLNRLAFVSRYYRLQSVVGSAGRPLFSPEELGIDGQLTGIDDAEYVPPISGTALERYKMACNHVP